MLHRWIRLALFVPLFAAVALAQRTQKPPAKEPSAAEVMIQNQTPKAIMSDLIVRERESSEHRNMYTYLSYEKSERTDGHLWTERVVEAPQGHVRKLVAIDSQPITAEREAQERGRLAQILKDPSAFEKHEQDRRKDEIRARGMVQMLDRAFLFENMRVDGDAVRIDFKPNPEYQPRSIEEKILHSMSGSITVDPKAVRIRRIESHLPVDVSIGFGVLATVHAGTNFTSERAPVESGEWKTRVIDTHVDGRALFFKTLSKNEHAIHEQFVRVPNDLTLEQAVARAQQ